MVELPTCRALSSKILTQNGQLSNLRIWSPLRVTSVILCHKAVKKDPQFDIRKRRLPLPSVPIISLSEPHQKKKSPPGRTASKPLVLL